MRRRPGQSFAIFTIALLFLAIGTRPGFSCSVCFGDPNSSMTQGALAGVLFLGGLIYLLLMGMGGFVALFYFRAKAYEREQARLADPQDPASLA